MNTLTNGTRCFNGIARVQPGDRRRPKTYVEPTNKSDHIHAIVNDGSHQLHYDMTAADVRMPDAALAPADFFQHPFAKTCYFSVKDCTHETVSLLRLLSATKHRLTQADTPVRLSVVYQIIHCQLSIHGFCPMAFCLKYTLPSPQTRTSTSFFHRWYFL